MWGRTWDELRTLMPPAVQRSLLPWEWSREKLWALDLPVTSATLDELSHLFDVPLWRGEDDAPFATPPNDVLARPTEYPRQFRRIIEADLAFPVHITRTTSGWIVLDGLHRMAKAALLGRQAVAARDVPPDLYDAFVAD